MERCSASLADSSSSQSNHQFFFINIDIKNVIYFLSLSSKKFIQLFGLKYSPRESIQKEAVFTVVFLQSVCSDLYYQFIRNQFPFVHVFLRLFPKLSAFFDIGTENVACGNVRNIVLFNNLGSLCAFAGSRRA